jgi:hypothetical protein
MSPKEKKDTPRLIGYHVIDNTDIKLVYYMFTYIMINSNVSGLKSFMPLESIELFDLDIYQI